MRSRLISIAILYGSTSASILHESNSSVKAEDGLAVPDKSSKKQDENQCNHIDSKLLPLDTCKDAENDVCGIWLAPSTIEGAGLGIYAGRSYQKGDFLSSDIAIAISDIDYHNLYKFEVLWNEYIWDAKSLNMISEGIFSVSVFSPGFGSAANSFFSLVNVEEYNPILQSSPPMTLHRSTDPGVGASTYFHQRESRAKTDIRIGQEFFVSYGAHWFTIRPQLGPIPLKDDLDRATSLLKKYTILSKYLTRLGMNKNVITDVWKTFIKNTKFRNSRIIGAFHHNNPDEIKTLQTKYNCDVKAFRIDQSIRNLEWLENNGVCGDHIYAATSTIPQANMGAFAARNLKQGTIVAALPFIHIAKRNSLDMYHLDIKGSRMLNTTITQQLLLNYCYGHSESSLLLCPYGPIVNYINHNQTKVNVKLQWSNSGYRMSAVLDQKLEEWASSGEVARLSMELVALRDISKDEEIFLNYGYEWEEAWNKHVANWKPVKGVDNYISAGQKNARLSKERLRTVFEESQQKMYPPNVDLKCDMAFAVKPNEVSEAIEQGRLEQYLREEDASWFPCEVLRYKEMLNNEYLYTVVIFYTKDDSYTEETIQVEDIPWQAFHFVDKPGTSDTFLHNTFRHDIRIPDYLFPDKWKNRKKKNTK